MIRMILTYILITVGIGFGIAVVREMSGQERWSLFKTAMFSLLCSGLALVLIMFVVVLF